MAKVSLDEHGWNQQAEETCNANVRTGATQIPHCSGHGDPFTGAPKQGIMTPVGEATEAGKYAQTAS